MEKNTELLSLVRRIWRRAYLDSEEECARWISEYVEKERGKIKITGGDVRKILTEQTGVDIP